MTHDSFAPPAGQTQPAVPPTAPYDGPPAAYYPYGTPLYTLPPLRSTAGLGTATIVLACLWTAFQVLRLATAPQATDALRAASDGGRSAWDSALTGYELVILVSIPVQVAVYVVACLWLYRSRSTAVAANPGFVHERSRVWSWLGWWVPIVSFWFPYQVVRDVRRATSPRPVSGIGLWWGSWLVFLTLSNGVERLTNNRSDGSAAAAADLLVGLELVSTVAMVVALALWVRIVQDVRRAQELRIAAAVS